jgi:uracil permease
MGGILILLFGAITVTGMNLLVQAKQDLMQPRAMTIAGIILVLTLGGMSIGQGEFSISGIGLGGVIGVLLNLLLPHPKARSAALS